jgi:dihydroxy-acid dehydratase
MEPPADEAGAGATAQDRNAPKYDDYIQFKTLPPGGPLNRWSHAVTREHDFPGAQVRFCSSLVGR